MKRTARGTKQRSATPLRAGLEGEGRGWIEAQYAKGQTKLAAIRKRRSSKKPTRELNRLAGREWIDAEYVREQAALAELRKRFPRTARRTDKKRPVAHIETEALTPRPINPGTAAPATSSRVHQRVTAKIQYKRKRRFTKQAAGSLTDAKGSRIRARSYANARRKKTKRKKQGPPNDGSSWRPTLSWSVPDTFLSSGLSGSKWSTVRGGRPLRGGLPGLGKKR
jgi:hypothetical protein